jgi:tetratricopeptide (TPR) repeat protein
MMVQPTPAPHISHTPTTASDAALIISQQCQYDQRQQQGERVANDGILISRHSTMAAHAIGDGNYRQALAYYQLALGEYLDGSPTVVELVNAAATCFNLGALSKKLQNYRQATQYYSQAEELYKSCSKKVRRAPDDGSATDTSSEVCLFQLIVETLQARAHLNYKYQKWLDEAIECHEEVIDVLEQQIEDDRDVVYFKIHFTGLSKEDRWKLLTRSLQSLGKFYVERGDFEDGLVAYQEALAVLKEQDSETLSTQQRQEELTQIIKALSDIYMKKYSATIKVPQLQRLAHLQADLSNWEGALTCWEQVLYLESQEHGEISTQVANVLCQIARVFTMQGNREGALDLYHAAIARYQQTNSQLPREAVGNTTNLFCQLQLHEDALDYMDDLIESVQTREETAWILCQRGRICLELGRLNDASEALCQSAELCDSEDDYVFKLLQKLEFLQQRVEVSDVAASPAKIDMPLECIIEDDEDSITTQDHGMSEHTRKTAEQPLQSIDERRQEEIVASESQETPSQAAESPNPSRASTPVSMTGDSIVVANSSDIIVANSTETIDRIVVISVSELSKDVSLDHEDTPEDESSMDYSDENSAEDTPSGSSKQHNQLEEDCQQTPKESKTKEAELTIHTDADPEMSASSHASDRGDHLEDINSETFPAGGNEVSAPLNPKGNVIDPTDDQGSTSEKSPPLPDSLSCSESINYECRGKNNQDKEPGLAPIVDTTILEQGGHEMSTDPEDSEGVLSIPVSPQSKTGLTPEVSEGSGHSHRPPRFTSSPRSQNGPEKREQPEDLTAPKLSKRNSFVKALGSPFRYTRSRSPFRRMRSKDLLQADGLDVLDEDKEINNFSEELDRTKIEEDSLDSFDGAPISYIIDDDDRSEISQLTFKVESYSPQKDNHDSQWWWGVTAEGLEGWFPTSYVHQAVEAAEGFLSAKSIHRRGKSRPLDYDSDEETKSDHGDATSETKPEDQQFPDQLEASKTALHSDGKVSNESPAKPSAGSESVRSTPRSKRVTLASQIEQQLAQLEEMHTDSGQQGTKAEMMFELAVLQGKNKEIDEALSNSQEALKMQKATNNLTDACKTLHFMAELNSRAKHYKAALACYAEAQKIQESVYGYYHEEIANTLNRQGNVLARQGEFDLAMDNHKEALRILKEYCGDEIKNPLVSQTLIQIGAVYYRERNSLKTIQNRDGYRTFIEADMLEVIARAHEERGSYRMAIAFFEEKLQCLDHDDKSDDLEQVAETLTSLGILSCRAGLYLEAIDFYDRALGIQMKLGCDDVQLAMAKVLAGSVQYSLGHFRKALKLFEDALHALSGEVGKGQETVAATLFHMGVVRVTLCDYDKAMSNLTDAMRTQQKLLGNEHPATLRTRREIGNLYAVSETQLDSATKEYDAVLEIQKRIHGERHPNVAETLHCLGCVQARRGDQTAALRTLENCYNMRLEFLGLDHPLQATTLHEIAKIRLQRGRVKKAIHICDSALQIRKESLSENHVDVATASMTKASCLVARGDFNEANQLFLEACAIAKEAVGEKHPIVAEIQVQIGTMHLRKCHFEEAAESVNKALEIYRAAGLNEDHRGFKDALKELERVERAEMLCV